MPAHPISARPIILGDTGLFGIRTVPENAAPELGLVTLNAGMLPSMGPFRLSVQLAEAIADRKIATLRIDQSGKGESPARDDMTPTEAAVADYDEAFANLRQVGVTRTILAGICSGAVDALRIADQRDSVKGLVLIDGYVERSPLWHVHRAITGIRWAISAGPSQVVNRFGSSLRRGDGPSLPSLSDDLRVWKSMDLHGCYGRVLAQGTRMLSIFSGDFWPYNHHGQLRRFLSSFDLTNFREVFLADADHTYTLASARDELLATVVDWIDTEFSGDLEDR